MTERTPPEESRTGLTADYAKLPHTRLGWRHEDPGPLATPFATPLATPLVRTAHCRGPCRHVGRRLRRRWWRRCAGTGDCNLGCARCAGFQPRHGHGVLIDGWRRLLIGWLKIPKAVQRNCNAMDGRGRYAQVRFSGYPSRPFSMSPLRYRLAGRAQQQHAIAVGPMPPNATCQHLGKARWVGDL